MTIPSTNPSFTLPQFPSKYRPAVEEQAKNVLSLLSSAFSSTASASSSGLNQPDNSAAGEIDQWRRNLEVLDDDICSELLQVLTLQHALKEAQMSYEVLKGLRTQVVAGIDECIIASRKLPVLPVEVLEVICSYNCNDHSSANKEIWGNILYKAVPVHCTFRSIVSNQVQVAIENGGRLHVDGWRCTTTANEVGETIRILSQWSSFGVWKDLKFSIPSGELGSRLCAAIVRFCGPSLSTVKRLEITNTSEQEVDIESVANSLQDLQLPVCSSIHIPLDLVQCFAAAISGANHLGVFFTGSWEFVSRLKRVDVRDLRSLELRVGDDNRNPRLYAVPNEIAHTISLPELEWLTIRINEFVSVESFLFVAGSVHCPRLQRLDILCGIMPSDADNDNELNKILMGIDSYFTSLQWISFHMIKDSWRFVAPVLEELQVPKPDGGVFLPKLNHLSIALELSYLEEAIDPLIKLLQFRKDADSCIHTIEIHTRVREPGQGPDDRQDLLLNYLGLFVVDVRVVIEITDD